MVAVAADERAHVLLVPVGEEQVVIVRRFCPDPAIESLIHHDEAHSVAKVQQLRRGRIVAGADGVAAHLLQHFELTFQGAGVDGGAERAEVVMIADAVELNALAVEQKAVVGGRT